MTPEVVAHENSKKQYSYEREKITENKSSPHAHNRRGEGKYCGEDRTLPRQELEVSFQVPQFGIAWQQST